VLLLCAAVAASVSQAEDESERRAREEVERQLRQLIGAPPTRVKIEFAALDEPNYELEEAVFELDGKSLAVPSTRQLAPEGTHLVWSGEVTPGRHTVRAQVVYANSASIVVSEEGAHKWKVGGDISFLVNAGIEVQVRVAPVRDPGQREIAKRLRLTLPTQPVMLARLDDGKMPEPLPSPEVHATAVPEEPAAAAPGEARTKRRTKRAKGDSSLESPTTALVVAEAAESEASRVEVEPSSENDAGGPPPELTVALPQLSDAGASAATGLIPTERASVEVEESESPPWSVIVGAGGVGLVVFLVLLARRRRSRPPSPHR
jgi:MYXO-CTERM domain-containing protein